MRVFSRYKSPTLIFQKLISIGVTSLSITARILDKLINLRLKIPPMMTMTILMKMTTINRKIKFQRVSQMVKHKKEVWSRHWSHSSCNLELRISCQNSNRTSKALKKEEKSQSCTSATVCTWMCPNWTILMEDLLFKASMSRFLLRKRGALRSTPRQATFLLTFYPLIFWAAKFKKWIRFMRMLKRRAPSSPNN